MEHASSSLTVLRNQMLEIQLSDVIQIFLSVILIIFATIQNPHLQLTTIGDTDVIQRLWKLGTTRGKFADELGEAETVWTIPKLLRWEQSWNSFDAIQKSGFLTSKLSLPVQFNQFSVADYNWREHWISRAEGILDFESCNLSLRPEIAASDFPGHRCQSRTPERCPLLTRNVL